MASKAIGFLNFKFGADLKGFDRAMKKAQKNLKRFGKNIQTTGRNLTTGLTLPILALGAASIKAFDAQEKAIAQVEAGLKSTGNEVGFTSEKLQQMASDLQKTTLFGDEEILKGATAQLLTFTNITGEQFAKTQKIALDLATRLDGDLKSASIMLGKALNDPVANLSALSRAGIQFSTEQKETIKSLVETNQLAEAQTIILTELEKQYGGSAEAASKAGMGPIKQLQNQLSDLSEQIGERLIPFVQSFVGWVTKLAEKFDGLSQSQKNNIITWTLFIATLGPVLIIVGKISIGISSLIKGFLTLRTGVLAASASFKVFRASMVRMTVAGWAANGMLGAMTGAFRVLKVAIMTNPIGILIGALALAAGAFLTYTHSTIGATVANDKFEGSTESAAEKIERLSQLVSNAGKDQFDIGIQETVDEIARLEEEIKSIEETLSDEGARPRDPLGLDLLYDQLEASKISLEDFKNLLKKLKKAQKTSNEVVIEAVEVNGEVTESTEKYSRSLDPLIANINKYSEAYRVLGADMQDVDFWTLKLTESQKIAKAGWMMFGDVLTSSLDSALNSQENFFDVFIKNIKKAITSLLVQLAVMTLISAIMPASLGGIGSAAFSSKNIMGNLGTLMNIPAMADGGIVTGPQMALIGEAGPEAVIPLDQLKNYGGAQQVEVVGKISGTDIFLSNRNTGTNRQRSV